HAAVEERQTGRHQQYEGGTGENPGGVAGVHGNLLTVSCGGERPRVSAASSGGGRRGSHRAGAVFLTTALPRFGSVNNAPGLRSACSGGVADADRGRPDALVANHSQ